MKLMSEEYLQLLRKKHADKPWGGAGHTWADHCSGYLDFIEPRPVTFLDYGCGRGTFKSSMEAQHPDEVVVHEYDPGIPEKSQWPEAADVVVCTDVLEHVEEQYVDDTLAALAGLTKKFCFMVIACTLSYSTLPDGRNTHLTVQPPAWWKDKVKAGFGKEFDIHVVEQTKGRAIFSANRK